MQLLEVDVLKRHPKNEYFFDDIVGAKWEEFLESVRTSGIIEPIVVSNELVIVSGHQRVRACKELGIPKILAEVHIYDDADAVLKDLIETNVRQRGVIDNTVKMGRIIKELERLYHIKDLPKNEMAAVRRRIRSFTGRSTEYMYRAKRASRLDTEIQSAVQSGKVSLCAAANTLSKLTEEEQIEFALALPAIEKWTMRQVEAYANMIKIKDNRLAALQADYSTFAAALDEIIAEEAPEPTNAINPPNNEEYNKLKEQFQIKENEYTTEAAAMANKLERQIRHNSALEEKIIKLKQRGDPELIKQINELEIKARKNYERAEQLKKALWIKEKEVEELKEDSKPVMPVVLTTEGLSMIITRFLDELESFEPMLIKERKKAVAAQYYRWLMEAARAAERAATICATGEEIGA